MKDLVARDAASFFRQTSSTPVGAALRSVNGIWIEDIQGNRLVDLHGNTAHHLGHAHPRLIAALKQQLDELAFCPRRYTNEPAVLLAERLRELWPGADARVLFATGGSDAIEIAIRLCRVATRRSFVIAFEGSYHGHGHGSLALSKAALDPRLGPKLPGIHHVTPYWLNPVQSLTEIEDALKSPFDRVACLVAEPLRSSCITPPVNYWKEVRTLCTRHGALLVFDEIPSGLGKTGKFFAFEHFGVVPDAAVLGKSLGGGIVPIAAVIADAALDVAPELDIGHYTHEKNPFTSRAALTTLDIIAEEDLIARASDLGAFALDEMAALARRNPFFKGGRGLGLLLALELAGEETRSRAAALARAAANFGISAVTKPFGAIGFSPPLAITRDQIVMTLDRLDKCAVSLSA